MPKYTNGSGHRPTLAKLTELTEQTRTKLTHTGQLQDADLDGSDQFCDPIRIFGIDDARRFSIFVTGNPFADKVARSVLTPAIG